MSNNACGNTESDQTILRLKRLGQKLVCGCLYKILAAFKPQDPSYSHPHHPHKPHPMTSRHPPPNLGKGHVRFIGFKTRSKMIYDKPYESITYPMESTPLRIPKTQDLVLLFARGIRPTRPIDLPLRFGYESPAQEVIDLCTPRPLCTPTGSVGVTEVRLSVAEVQSV